MIYLFTGTDSDKARTKAFEWVAKARTKEPNLAYVRLSREELSEETLLEAAISNSLFAARTLTLIDDPYASKQTEESDDTSTKATALDEFLEQLAATDNAIVILAPKLTAAKRKKIEGLAKMTYAYDAPVRREAVRGFNSALVNALGSRSRETLWLEIERTFAAGDAAEMTHGLLHWKARDLMEKGSPKWSPQEARALSLELIALLQESRRGGLPLERALERWALEV